MSSSAHRPPPHPGQVLLVKFLQPRRMMQVEVAREIGMAQSNLTAFIGGRRALTPWMAWELARVMRTKPQYWMKLQGNYELWQARPRRTARRAPAKRRRR